MLRSMTGFAATNIALSTNQAKTNISLNLKSLNSRFFEVTCKLPHQLTGFEVDLLKILKEKLLRGHIYITLYMSNQDLLTGTVEPAMKTVTGYINAAQTIQKAHGLQDTVSINTLLQLPNVFTIQDVDLDESSKQRIFKAIDDLIQQVINAQEKEGTALKKDLEQRASIMSSIIEQIATSSAALVEVQKEKVKKTLQELGTENTSVLDIQKHAAYVLLDKMDINEEIVRFKSHLKNFTGTLNSADIEKGKRLDFILQEMAREINTIAAKCSDATISHHAINIKVELEKAREQTQNIV